MPLGSGSRPQTHDSWACVLRCGGSFDLFPSTPHYKWVSPSPLPCPSMAWVPCLDSAVLPHDPSARGSCPFRKTTVRQGRHAWTRASAGEGGWGLMQLGAAWPRTQNPLDPRATGFMPPRGERTRAPAGPSATRAKHPCTGVCLPRPDGHAQRRHWGIIHLPISSTFAGGGGGGGAGPQKVRRGAATELQPRLPSHSLHCLLSSTFVRCVLDSSIPKRCSLAGPKGCEMRAGGWGGEAVHIVLTQNACHAGGLGSTGHSTTRVRDTTVPAMPGPCRQG